MLANDGAARAGHAPDGPLHRAAVAHGFDDVAGAGLALGADHRGAFGDTAQSLPKVAAATHKRHCEVVLVDVVNLIRGREHFRLVYVVDTEGFKDLRLHKVADTCLCHDRDRDGLLDRCDHRRVGHAGDAAVPERSHARGKVRGVHIVALPRQNRRAFNPWYVVRRSDNASFEVSGVHRPQMSK